MFKRFVRNRHISKIAAIILALILIICALWRIVTDVFRDKYIEDMLENAMLTVYTGMVSAMYNIEEYESARENAGSEIDKALADNYVDRALMYMVNGQSTLYQYINSNVEIEYSYKDPAYRQVLAQITERVNEKSVAVADSEEKEEESGQDEKEKDLADNKSHSDYVAPVVSESGVTYTMEQLKSFDFLMSKLYTVPDRAQVYESDLVAEDMLSKDMTIQGDNSKPQILIYHTHSQEGFADSVAGDDSTSIVAVGTYLAKILSEEYGYNVIHCTEHFDMAGGTLDRSTAYTYAQGTIEQILEDNPSIEVILDIHRDGLPDGADKLVTEIGGKQTAKIMLFNGVSRSSASGDIDYLYNRYRADNLAFSFQLKLMAMKCYPEFTRRNYIDAYQYNLHHRQKSVLVEVGAQNNTLQEALNAMEVLSEVLNRVLSPDK